MTSYDIEIRVKKEREYNWKSTDTREYSTRLNARSDNKEDRIPIEDLKNSVNLMIDKLTELADKLEDVNWETPDDE